MAERFAGIGGDWIEERFTPAQKKAFLEQFVNFEEVHLERDYSIKVTFRGSFDDKVKKAVEAVAQQCIEIALAAGIELYHVAPKVYFYTLAEWLAKRNPAPEVDLPAAKLDREKLPPEISIILPTEVTRSEEVIKTVRLLCSKLFGSLFFMDHVPRRPPYALMIDASEVGTPEFQDQLEFIDFLEATNPILDQLIAEYAKGIMIRGPKGLEIARKEFFKEARKNPKPTAKAALESVFQDLRKRILQDGDAFYEDMADRIFAKVAQSFFLLPHERANFEHLREKKLWTLFHAFEERLSLVSNHVQELFDCRAFLEKATEGKPLEDDLIELWQKTLSQRNNLLLKKKLVRLFLFDTARLSDNQHFDRASFSLWLYKKGLFKGLTNPKHGAVMAQKLTEQYKNSVFQKLYEASHRLKELLKWMKKNPGKTWKESRHYERLKVLITGFEIRQEGFQSLLASCRLLKGLEPLVKQKGAGKKEALACFEEGWAYFISFALIHQYYLSMDQKKKDGLDRAGKFMAAINDYSQQRLEEPSYRIAELFVELYRERKFDLSKMPELIRNEAETLDFFVLHQAALFEQEKKDAREIIQGYKQSLDLWQIKRYQNQITDAERAKVADRKV